MARRAENGFERRGKNGAPRGRHRSSGRVGGHASHGQLTLRGQPTRSADPNGTGGLIALYFSCGCYIPARPAAKIDRLVALR